jgi:hypothetical protein
MKCFITLYKSNSSVLVKSKWYLADVVPFLISRGLNCSLKSRGNINTYITSVSRSTVKSNRVARKYQYQNYMPLAYMVEELDYE